MPANGNKGPRWWNFGLKAIRLSFPKAVFLPAMGLSLLIHALVLVAGYLAAQAVGIKISFFEAGAVLGLTFLALAVPVTIAGLGVREGMLIWLLAVFGYKSTSAAIGMSGCLLSIALFWAAVGGMFFFLKPRFGSQG